MTDLKEPLVHVDTSPSGRCAVLMDSNLLMDGGLVEFDVSPEGLKFACDELNRRRFRQLAPGSITTGGGSVRVQEWNEPNQEWWPIVAEPQVEYEFRFHATGLGNAKEIRTEPIVKDMKEEATVGVDERMCS